MKHTQIKKYISTVFCTVKVHLNILHNIFDFISDFFGSNSILFSFHMYTFSCWYCSKSNMCCVNCVGQTGLILSFICFFFSSRARVCVMITTQKMITSQYFFLQKNHKNQRKLSTRAICCLTLKVFNQTTFNYWQRRSSDFWLAALHCSN